MCCWRSTTFRPSTGSTYERRTPLKAPLRLPRRPRATDVDAVRCAVAVQQAMPGRNTGIAAASAAKGEVFGRRHCLCDPREYPPCDNIL